ncbi:sensor histidine kinase [Rhizobium paknamense]|uniref:sensor histidine kinase n=1 Tax=Rhizobium paknamense TaxID=1206817 RepID=UPI003F9DEDE8
MDTASDAFPRHAGKMADLIRGYDWTTSPLGPITGWSQELKQAVNIMLPAEVQIVMFWGPQFVALYNDAYAPTIGDKHPGALGRPAVENWTELWDDLEPLLSRVLEQGETVHAKDRPFYIERYGYPETVYFDISYSPVRNERGAVLGVFCIVRETTELKRAHDVERRLAAIIASSEDAIIGTDLDLKVTSWNAGAESLLGYRREEALGMPITLLFPEDESEEERSFMARIRAGERIPPRETVRRRKDGSLVDVSLTVSPIYDSLGELIGAAKIARDITDRKEAERMQAVLTRELNHRVKNLLATVTAIARQTLGRSPTGRDLSQAFEARLRSLATAHDLLTRANWEQADLSDIVTDVLAPYPSDRFNISGPKLNLPPKAVVAMTLALHELATNAAKYGALSNATGQITISWTVTQAETPLLDLAWIEQDGPEVLPPASRGFGSRLIENVLSAELKGEVRLDYPASGVTCRVTAQIAAEPA